MHHNDLSSYIERNCERLNAFLREPPAQVGEDLAEEVAKTPDPQATAGRLDDLIARDPDNVLAGILTHPDKRPAFLASVSGSRFLFTILCRRPELLEEVFLRQTYRAPKNRIRMEEDLSETTSGLSRLPDFNSALRRYKEQEYLRIGARDLSDAADVREVMRELSDLAGACTQIALEFHVRMLSAKYGAPPDAVTGSGITVIGMGKVSGGELNFSSDLDLVFFSTQDQGRTTGPESISVKRYYETLARSIIGSLSEVTEEGFVFRVDTRLRPEGERGELVPSVDNALQYYLDWGRTWERAALMKAVPLAGDLDLGWNFLKDLEPFIYRKFLDYSTLEDMRDMKLKVAAQLRRKPGINIKLGQGGIREIEFFVQTLQLINGGKNPAVRSPSTLEALRLLVKHDLLDENTARDLDHAYCFFRKTEHRIQINHQLQTHELPRTKEEQAELARRMGYADDSLETFLADLEEQRVIVGELFTSLFYQAEETVEQNVSSEARRICESIHDEEASIPLLESAGFQDPKASYGIMKRLVAPDDTRRLSDKGRTHLERLGPLFVDELLQEPEPDRALAALDSYVDSLKVGAGYLATLRENPATVGFLIKILGESSFFTDLLIRHPASIDSLIARHSSEPIKDPERLREDLAQRLAYCEHLEDALDVLRMFKHEEILRLGVRHLLEELDSPSARWLISELAEVCLQGAIEIAFKEMERKFGSVGSLDTVPFTVVGMGKLGGREMTYLSDLDVLFVYDAATEEMGRLSTHEWFSRFAARIISTLSVPTSEGIAFEMDTRLRPSGRQGPLVSSLDSFRNYHRSTSKLWEKQALTRARCVSGPAELKDQVETIIRTCILDTQLTDHDLGEISRLRSRIEHELAHEDTMHVDLKTGHGGLVDVEFYVQAHVLLHAGTHPEVLHPNTLEALLAMRRARLIDEEAFALLDSGYRFLTTLEDRVRIMERRSVDRISLDGDRLRAMVYRLGYRDESVDIFISDYFRITRAIRRIYRSFFEPPDSET